MTIPPFESPQWTGRRASLLVVDDQPANVRVLSTLFWDEFEVLTATSGEQALHKARAHQPDLILLDVIMPGLSGHEVCRMLKDDPSTSGIPVIFLTAQSTSSDEVLGLELGAVDFISKPINPRIVQARVRAQLALKLQYDFMRNIALMDGLTGVANRRRFDEALAQNWALCQRESRPLSLLLIDVDHFKRYNDHHGHLAGDQCLQAIARALEQTVRRPVDLLARYGGEEFACVLPFGNSAAALGRAESMLAAVRELQLEHRASPSSPHVTVSIGVATVVPSADMASGQLVHAADEALYASKQAGRACCSVFDFAAAGRSAVPAERRSVAN